MGRLPVAGKSDIVRKKRAEGYRYMLTALIRTNESNLMVLWL